MTPESTKIDREKIETFQEAYELYKKVLSSHAYYKINDPAIS